MEATELLNEIRQLRRITSQSKYKYRRSTKEKYIIQKNKNKCVYCKRKFSDKQLRTTVESYHTVKQSERITTIANRYRTTVEEIKKANHLKNNELSKGTMLRIPSDFNVFPNTHGICFCRKCGDDKHIKSLDHVGYVRHLLSQRKKERDLVDSKLKQKIIAKDNYECFYCLIEFGKTLKNEPLTIDHKKPIVSGGTSDKENLCTCCLYHNQDKRNMLFEDYLKKIRKRKKLKENTYLYS